MSDKTHATPAMAMPLEANEQMTTRKAPPFSLGAGGGGEGNPNGGGGGAHKQGGDGNGNPYMVEVNSVKQPINTFPILFPGQVSWVHSPCFSQELEALAFQVSEGSMDYASGSGQIAATIMKLSQTPFRNAGGLENDWANRMLSQSVPMNVNNMAATIAGTGYPKLVVLTFWNDPSNPVGGGVNHGYFIEVKFPEELKIDGGGGFIFMGDRKGADPGRITRDVVSINTFMSTVLDMLQRMQTMTPDWAKNNPKEAAQLFKLLLERFKSGMDAGTDIKTMEDMNKNPEEVSNPEASKYVMIDGNKLEKGVVYKMSFKIDGHEHKGDMTPEKFLNQYGKDLKNGKVSHFTHSPIE